MGDIAAVRLCRQVFLPPLSEVVITASRLLYSGTLQEHLLASSVAPCSGLTLAIVTAVPLG
jgi:ABC-type nitrate/sulfonate/bicarbonate transport system permease component